MLKQQAGVIAKAVWLVDLGLTAAAFLGAFWIRDVVLPLLFPTHFPAGLFPIETYLKVLPVALIIWSLLFFTHHSYHSHRTMPLLEEARTTLRIVATGVVLLATVAWFGSLRDLSRSWFLIFGTLCALLLLAEKVLLRLVARWVRSRGYNFRTIVMVGTGRQARRIVELIESHRHWGYRIAGFVTDGNQLPGEWSRYELLGDLSDLPRIVGEGTEDGHVVDEIVFAVTRRNLEACEKVFPLCEELGIRTRIAMNFLDDTSARVELEELEGIPFVTYTTTPTNGYQLLAKRTIDVAMSALLLAVSLPLLFLTAAAIKMTSSGTVLYRQRRVGLNGRLFTLYKFRTMIADAHERRHEVEHLNEMDGPAFKVKKDPRVTPIGKFLRRFSLDELPQLWNVLRGDMSLVGPRPPIPEEVDLYERWQRRRLSMKPGLTCLWQVSGRNDVDFDRWIELDLQYIDNWSPALDLKIILRTIPAVITGRGAH